MATPSSRSDLVMPVAAEIITFWRSAGAKRWFAKSEAFDDIVRTRFEAAHMAAAGLELEDWAETSDGALALILLLDQFPRNMYRRTAHQFATDPLARSMAKRALDAGFDVQVDPDLRLFLSMPLQHSESLADQDRSVALANDGGAWTGSAVEHRSIIIRFGRFPHRNAVLGRPTTAYEAEFLEQGGFAG